MRKLIISIVAVLVVSSTFGQQILQFSQYMNSKFLINPAATGISGKMNVTMGSRSQYVGLDQPVSAYFAGGNYTLGQGHDRLSYIDNSIRVSNPDLFKHFDSTGVAKHVVGGYVTGNNFFPIKSNAFNGLYSFHYPFHEFYIAGGAALNINSFNVNFDDIELMDEDDQEYLNFLNGNSKTIFSDLTLGVLFYSHNLYFGYSINRIAPNKVRFSSQYANITLNTHHFVSIGSKIDVSESFTVKPSILVKALKNLPVTYDINTMVEYKKFITGGLSYRSNDAVAIMAGIIFNDHYALSYSYDVTTSPLSQVSSGSHEIVISAKY